MQKQRKSLNQTNGKDLRDRKPNMDRKNRNQGFTLVEAVIAVSILAILLGMMSLSMNAIPGFRAQRAAKSITAALDRTRIEAMNRLVAEMVLEKKSDGYYISYYIDRGKTGSGERVAKDEPEKIAPSGTRISITKSAPDGSDRETKNLDGGDSIILTYDRATGAFLPLQDAVLTQDKIIEYLDNNTDIPFETDRKYCTEIIVSGGFHTSTIKLAVKTGTYTVSVG